MKIGNSTVQFNTSINRHKLGQHSIADVPYWKLYTRKGDCFGKGVRFDNLLTYDEIVEYLTNFEGHHVLEAFPRWNLKTRHSIKYQLNDGKMSIMAVDKHTGEILYEADVASAETLYLSCEYKSDRNFKRACFYHSNGKWILMPWFNCR